MSATPAMPFKSALPKEPGELMSTAVDRALRWLSRSGVVISDTKNTNYGAVYSFFDERSKRYRLIYAEGTGYLLSFWKYLRATNRAGDLDGAACAAADWLVRWATSHGGSVAMGIDAGVAIRQAYAFDNGICAKGLLDLYEVTGESRYVDAAQRILRRLLAGSVNDDGSVRAVVDLDSGRFLDDGKVWYTTSGSFHAKISIPLLQLSSITGDQRLTEATQKICAWTLRQQSADGSFPANIAMRNVNLHAHCYTTEALLYAYAMSGDPAFRDAAEKAILWILDQQAANGSLRLWHGARILKRRASYAMAQSIRLFLLLYTLTHREALIEAATRTAAFLERMQPSSADPRIDGGFYGEDITRSGILIRKNREVTSWATMFAIQALDLLPTIRSLNFDQCIRWLF